ncbi:MAG: hypothetical protein ABJG78_02400 [Cyclobacteriaceae bacterium]
MNRKMNIKALVFGVLLATSASLSAQRFPSTTSIQLLPPYSTNLEEYASMANDRVMVTAVFNDFSVPSFSVRFKLTIKSGNVSLQTNPNAVFEPIQLLPGQLEQFSGFDLAEYFNINNMVVSGIEKSELLIGQGLPEGMYTFTIEIVDYRSGITISNEATAMAPVFLNDPPQIVFPTCGTSITEIEPQNIQFQWLPLHLGSPNSAFSTEYELTLVEVPEGLNPEEAMRSALPTFQTTVASNSFLYDVSAPLLQNGKTYAYRVRAIDSDNLGLFKNDGYSNVCWFKFGFNTDGDISLKGPENNSIVNGRNRLVFSWDAPNNLEAGQLHRYEYKLVKLEEGENPEEAIFSKPSFYEEQLGETSAAFGSSFTLPVDLDAESQYAWQVKAYSSNIEVASSQPSILNSSPKISSFFAGSQQVKIITLANEDFNNLSGKGLLKLEQDGAEYEVTFSGLRLKVVAGKLILDNGEINYRLPERFSDILLIPDVDKNGEAIFHPSRIRLDKRKLEIFGQVNWGFHLPKKDGEPIIISSDSLWMNYDVLKLNGPAKLHANNRFELLEPYDFQLNLSEESDFYITNNFYKQRFSGQVVMPSNVASGTGKEVAYSFSKWSQLFYNTLNLDLKNDPVSLTRNTNISLIPETAVLDFSFEESSGALGNDAEWVGLNYEKYAIQYESKLDPDQLELPETLTHDYTQTTSSEQKGWITNGGLQFEINRRFDEDGDGIAFFNEFRGSLKELKLLIEDSEVSEGHVKGFIRIPVVSEDERFFYTLPVTTDGFEVGYLDEELEERYFSFNRYGGENKVDFTIKRAVFAQNERLDLVVDVELPTLGITMTGVEDFRAYGDYFIGFGKRNGALPLAQQVVGEYDGFDLFIDQVGASFANGSYAFSYSATMPLGEEFSGDNGPPRINMHSVEPLGDEHRQFAGNASQQNTDLPAPLESSQEDPKLLTFDSLAVRATSPIVDFNGYLLLVKDDPEWGTSFQGGVAGKLKMPTEVGIGANLILGDKDKTKYWYFDAWYVDEQGTGINVFELFSLVGLEGRVYHHMSLDGELPVKNGRPNLVVDPDLDFGAGLYMQMIDTKGGKLFKVDVGAEIKVERTGFTVQMEGDMAMLNSEGRSPGAGAALKKEVAKEVANEAAGRATAALLDDIDIEVPIGDLTFGLKSNELGGAVTFEMGDASFDFIGDVSATPKTTLNASLGSKRLSISGDANAESSFSLQDGNNIVGLSVDGSQSGSLDVGFGEISLKSAYDTQVGTAGFNLTYEDKVITLGADAREGNGNLELQYEEGKRMYVEADKAGKGAFEFELDEYTTSLLADKEAGTGSFSYSDQSNQFQTSLDTKAGTASLKLEIEENLFDAAIDRAGKGNLSFTNDNTFFKLEGDRTTGNGQLEFIYDADNRFFASLEDANKAVLELEKGTNRIAMSGDRSEKSGQLVIENTEGRLSAAVNQSARTGKVGLQYGGDSIYTEILSDSANIALAFEGKQLSVAKTSTAGYLDVIEGEQLLSVRVNTDTQSGSMLLQQNEDKLFASVNKSQQNGQLELDYKGKSLNASIDQNELTFNLTNGNESLTTNVNRAGVGEIGIDNGSFSLGLALDATSSSGAFALKAGDIHLKISSQNVLDLSVFGTDLSFDPSGIGGPIIISEAGVPREVPLDENGSGQLALEIEGKRIDFSIDNGEAIFQFSEGNDTYDLSVDEKGNRAIGYETGGVNYVLSQNSGMYSLVANEYELTYTNGGALTFSEGASKSIAITSELVKLNYEDHVVEFGTDKSLFYENGERSFAFNTSGAELKEGNHLVSLGSDQSLLVKDGNKSFSYADNQLEAQYDKYAVTLDADYKLTFNDGTKSFDLNSEKLSLSDGDKTVSVINQQEDKELALSFEGRSASLSKEEFAFEEQDKTLELGGENFISYQTEAKQFEVSGERILFEDGDKKLSYGGDNFIELTDGGRSMKVTQEKALVILEGTKTVRLNADRSAEFTDDQLKFTLGGNSVASFSDGNSSVMLNSKGRSKYGVTFESGEYKLGLSTEKFRKAKLDIESPQVNLSLMGDANRNFETSFIKDSYNVTLKGGQQGISVEGIEDLFTPEEIAGVGEPEPANAEYLEGTEAPEMTGPMYIGKVTDGADGRIRGKAQFYYSSRDRHLIVNGAVSSTLPPCLDGAFSIESRPDYWRVNVGSKERKVWIKPVCSIFEGNGYLQVDSRRFDVGVGYRWSAGGSVKVGGSTLGARVRASASAELGVEAAAQFEPYFAIRRAGIWASASATLDLDYWTPIKDGTVRLFRVDMAGNLVIEFEDRTRVYGRLDGYFEILGIIEEDFTINFDQRF